MEARDLQAIVARLRRQGTDDAQVEVKSAAEGLPKSIWATVSAFGNAHGGVIVLGLDESRGFEPAKGFRLDRVRDQFVSGVGDGGADNAQLVNAPQYDLDRFDFEGAQVLVIEIFEVDPSRKPCYVARRGVANGSYKRVDDKDIKLSYTEIYSLQSAFVPSGADQAVIPEAMMSDLDEQVVDAILTNEALHHPRSLEGASSREERMRRLNMISSSGEVRLAGLLAAGYFPQQFFPRFCVDVIVFPGLQKGAAGSVRYLDRVTCEGPLHAVIDDATAAVMRNLRTMGVVVGVGRRDVPEIPRAVVREAITNAVVHREYDVRFSGQFVTVEIYDDRVEVTSPGGLWGGKTLGNIADGVSRCRNAAIMRLATNLPSRESTAPPSEGAGTGVPFMIRAMDDAGLEPPEFVADFDMVRVVLRRPSYDDGDGWYAMEADGGFVPVAVQGAASGENGGGGRQGSAQKASAVPALRGEAIEYAIISLLEDVDEPMGVQDIASKVGVPVWTARRHVRVLVEKGKAKPTAATTSRNRKYVAVK